MAWHGMAGDTLGMAGGSTQHAWKHLGVGELRCHPILGIGVLQHKALVQRRALVQRGALGVRGMEEG